MSRKMRSAAGGPGNHAGPKPKTKKARPEYWPGRWRASVPGLTPGTTSERPLGRTFLRCLLLRFFVVLLFSGSVLAARTLLLSLVSLFCSRELFVFLLLVVERGAGGDPPTRRTRRRLACSPTTRRSNILKRSIFSKLRRPLNCRVLLRRLLVRTKAHVAHDGHNNSDNSNTAKNLLIPCASTHGCILNRRPANQNIALEAGAIPKKSRCP